MREYKTPLVHREKFKCFAIIETHGKEKLWDLVVATTSRIVRQTKLFFEKEAVEIQPQLHDPRLMLTGQSSVCEVTVGFKIDAFRKSGSQECISPMSFLN